MEVNDGGARLGGGNGLVGNLLGRNRQMRRHGRRVDRSGHRTCDYYLLACLCHFRNLPVLTHPLNADEYW